MITLSAHLFSHWSIPLSFTKQIAVSTIFFEEKQRKKAYQKPLPIQTSSLEIQHKNSVRPVFKYKIVNLKPLQL
jgi:hypothetical protein